MQFQLTSKGLAYLAANKPRGGNAPWVRPQPNDAINNPKIERNAK